MKKYLAFVLLLLIGIAFADMTCSYDSNPNIGSNLNINCGSQPSISSCKALVFATDTTINIGEYPQYPQFFFQEDKKPYYTFPDGSFMFSIFMDDKTFFRDANYSVNITCFNPADNSTNSTTITFAPTIYSNLEWVSNYVLWARVNADILFVYVVLVVLIILAVIWVINWFKLAWHGRF